jgi:hypothetical protein
LETLTALVNETARLKDIPKMQVVIYEDKFESANDEQWLLHGTSWANADDIVANRTI